MRPQGNNDEPELQWLEDSVNYLVGTTFALIGAILKIILSVVVDLFRAFTKTKCD
jgi:hypothetical protein